MPCRERWCLVAPTEQLERLRLLPENVWNEIEAMENGINPKGGMLAMKGCTTVFFGGVIAGILFLAGLGGLIGLYYAAGQPCLPGAACNVMAQDLAGTVCNHPAKGGDGSTQTPAYGA